MGEGGERDKWEKGDHILLTRSLLQNNALGAFEKIGKELKIL